MTQLIARGVASAGFDDEAEEPPVKPLTRDEAQALRVKSPQLSPWRVIAAQVVVGCLMALGAWWFSDQPGFVQSAIYGAIVAVLPGALMARGMTSRLSSLSVGSSAVRHLQLKETAAIDGKVKIPTGDVDVSLGKLLGHTGNFDANTCRVATGPACRGSDDV